MKEKNITIFLLCLFLFTKIHAQEIVGSYRFNIKFGTGKITSLKSTDKEIKYKQYEIILSREMMVNDNFGVEFGIGGGEFKIQDTPPANQSMPNSMKTGLILINPKVFFTKDVSLGVFFTPFIPKAIPLSSTELAIVNKGLNFEIRNCLINKINCGLFYSDTESTTKRTLKTSGFSLGFDF